MHGNVNATDFTANTDHETEHQSLDAYHGGQYEPEAYLAAEIGPPDPPVDPPKNGTTPAPEKRRYNAVRFDDVEFDLATSYLIKGVIDPEGFSVLFGESGTTKTFFALNLAVRLALGKKFFGRQVRQAAVVYIAAEAGTSIKKRILAIRQHMKTEGFNGYVPILIIPTAVNLHNLDGDALKLIPEIQQYEKNEGVKVGLIVVDTLSRAMNGGNENAPDDMGQFVGNCDRLRKAAKCHLMVVHHSGKDTSKGARGHSLLRAAADTEIEITKETGQDRTYPDKCVLSRATVLKQRDGEIGATFGYELVPVHLGVDDDGDAVTSCVIKPVGAELLQPKIKLSGQAKLALECLIHIMNTDPKPMPRGVDYPSTGHPSCVYLSGFRERFYSVIMGGDKGDTAQKAFTRAKNKLQELGIIGASGDYVWPTGQTGHNRTK